MSMIKVFGPADEWALRQLQNCMGEYGARGVLCADHHPGYSQPIGGAIAYPDLISPSGVGYDIACGNKAVLTPLKVEDVNVVAVMDEIKNSISFGIGRANKEPVDHPVLANLEDSHLATMFDKAGLLGKAAEQLGTVGSGNHYVDLLVDEQGRVWVGVHFGSRGLGHGIASGFLALAQGKQFGDRVGEGGMDAPPTLLDVNSTLGEDYLAAMHLAGDYAYAGRDWVVDKVLAILGTHPIFGVHNHHNFAWREKHFDQYYWVVRKGCTPAFPGQRGFVGGSMGDISVILEGVDSEDSKAGLYSTVHGAGRVMSRSKAGGKSKWKGGRKVRVSKGVVDWDQVNRDLKARGIVVRGGDADEAPEVYRPLAGVLEHHAGTIQILYTLQPIGVAMAGYDTYDPYKD